MFCCKVNFCAHSHCSLFTGTAKENRSFYGCPIYKKPSRTDRNYIAEVELRTNTNVSPDNWVLRGVALLCDVK